LTELLRCPHCNTPMTTSCTIKKGVHHPYYVHRKHKRNPECSLPANIPADKLDETVWAKLTTLIEEHFDEPVMKGVFSSNKQTESEEITTIRNQIDDIRKAILKKQNEHDNIVRNLGQSIQMAGERVAEVLKGYGEDIKELNSQLQEQEATLKDWEQQNSVDNKIVNILQNKHKNLNQLPFQKRKDIALNFINQIVLKEDHIMLEMKSIANPVIGLLKKRPGLRSHPYSYLDIQWL